jgi:hypothetical protein
VSWSRRHVLVHTEAQGHAEEYKRQQEEGAETKSADPITDNLSGDTIPVRCSLALSVVVALYADVGGKFMASLQDAKERQEETGSTAI